MFTIPQSQSLRLQSCPIKTCSAKLVRSSLVRHLAKGHYLEKGEVADLVPLVDEGPRRKCPGCGVWVGDLTRHIRRSCKENVLAKVGLIAARRKRSNLRAPQRTLQGPVLEARSPQVVRTAQPEPGNVQADMVNCELHYAFY